MCRKLSFIVVVDQSMCMTEAEPRKEDTNSVIILMERETFRCTKAIVSDNIF